MFACYSCVGFKCQRVWPIMLLIVFCLFVFCSLEEGNIINLKTTWNGKVNFWIVPVDLILKSIRFWHGYFWDPVGALQLPFFFNSSAVGNLCLHLFEDAFSSNPWRENGVCFICCPYCIFISVIVVNDRKIVLVVVSF